MDYKSVLAGGQHRGEVLAAEVYPELVEKYPVKFWWFKQNGYEPHVWQATFHGAQRADTGLLTRFRHLVAGRRGGKTMGAAWETVFYADNPSEFHRDVHGIEADEPLWIWVLTKDYPMGFPALTAVLKVMRECGFVKGHDFNWNKTEGRIEFLKSGSIIQFKTAVDPESLRGAGLDILWIDEAASIESDAAYLVASPGLGDKEGIVYTTTTPHGKNWLYEEFFMGAALDDPNEFRVQYTSIDSPYFKKREWERYKVRFHPIFFKQEFLASFDAFQGIALQGEWLKFWVDGQVDPKTSDISIRHLRKDDHTLNLTIYMGVDPAASLSDTADYFAMAVVGVTEDFSQIYLLETFKERLPFPDQLDMIREWQLKWRPQMIGVESNAYQTILAQQTMRLDTFPNVAAIFSKGKKAERILAMAPFFKTGRIRLNRAHGDFIDQWLAFDPEKKNQKDDVLDAVEIAIGTAGVLLPSMPHESLTDPPPRTVHSDALDQIRSMQSDNQYDPELGSEA